MTSLSSMCVAVVASLTREMAVRSFAYHAHGINPAVIHGHDKTLNQQCMVAQARPPMIVILLVITVMYCLCKLFFPTYCQSKGQVSTSMTGS